MKNWLDKYQNNSHLQEYQSFGDGGNMTPFEDYYHTQPLYTEELIKKYPKVPIKQILQESLNKPFHNFKLDQMADSLKNKYGEIYLDDQEINNLIKTKNYPNIIDIDRSVKDMDKQLSGKEINTKGVKEGMPEKFGWRMLMQRSYPKGKVPYKYLEGAENGKQLQLLDNLTNFTNYNTPQPSGWLQKYSS